MFYHSFCNGKMLQNPLIQTYIVESLTHADCDDQCPAVDDCSIAWTVYTSSHWPNQVDYCIHLDCDMYYFCCSHCGTGSIVVQLQEETTLSSSHLESNIKIIVVLLYLNILNITLKKTYTLYLVDLIDSFV